MIQYFIIIAIIIIFIITYKNYDLIINEKTKNFLAIESFNNNNPYNFIDIIYFINLDYRTDRRDLFITEMTKINFPNNKIKRISAIKNDNGALGCSCSHIKTLKEFISSPYNICLIFEDDFEFIVSESEFKIQLTNIFNNNIDFDVISLSANAINLQDTQYDYLKKIYNSQTASGYMITKKFAINNLIDNFIIGKYLLENNSNYDHMYAIDQYWKLLQPENNWYLFYPKIGKQRESYSDIQKGHVNYELFSDNNYITIEIKGGLGNQLFQIFTLISYCIDNNKFFYLVKILVPGHREVLYYDNILKELDIYTKISHYSEQDYIEPVEFKYNLIPNFTSDTKLIGYFQSYKYFDNNKNSIIKFLKLENIKDNYKYKYDYLNTVSLHFRLGDYAQYNFYIIEITYYIQALNDLIDKTKKNDWDILYVYEQNDASIVLNNIDILKQNFVSLNFIGIDTNLQDYEQLLIMSLCKHNIISNSTFSWFAAYLNDNENLVYYPKVWINKQHNYDDLFLEKWIGLN
jgi:GR25 family glycosyltransferase involved in LPS biosynthesis